MAIALPIRPADYYDFFPDLDHRCGDIWADLPSFGMLSIQYVSGLVVTPACDLQNNKVESITYLPIVPVRRAFTQRGLLPELVRTVDTQLAILGLDQLVDVSEKFVPIEPQVLDRLHKQVTEKVRSASKQKDKEAAKRALLGLDMMKDAYGHEKPMPVGESLRKLYGSAFDKIAEKIVTNSYRVDCHFLPNDLQPKEWTCVTEPSLVLFRSPFSVPIEIFDRAQDISRADWNAEVSRLVRCIPGTEQFRARRPMKRQTVKPRFLADLVTRYVSMHVRLGSPDFTDEAVKSHVGQIIEAG